jgi:hypothetical protein
MKVACGTPAFRGTRLKTAILIYERENAKHLKVKETGNQQQGLSSRMQRASLPCHMDITAPHHCVNIHNCITCSSVGLQSCTDRATLQSPQAQL